MSDFYHGGSRELQDRFDTRRLADRIVQRLVVDYISDADRAFIEARDMLFLATAGEDGQPSCSYKGERSSFVPQAGCPTPVPNWKKSDRAADVLPEKDPARS